MWVDYWQCAVDIMHMTSELNVLATLSLVSDFTMHGSRQAASCCHGNNGGHSNKDNEVC